MQAPCGLDDTVDVEVNDREVESNVGAVGDHDLAHREVGVLKVVQLLAQPFFLRRGTDAGSNLLGQCVPLNAGLTQNVAGQEVSDQELESRLQSQLSVVSSNS